MRGALPLKTVISQAPEESTAMISKWKKWHCCLVIVYWSAIWVREGPRKIKILLWKCNASGQRAAGQPSSVKSVYREWRKNSYSASQPVAPCEWPTRWTCEIQKPTWTFSILQKCDEKRQKQSMPKDTSRNQRVIWFWWGKGHWILASNTSRERIHKQSSTTQLRVSKRPKKLPQTRDTTWCPWQLRI